MIFPILWSQTNRSILGYLFKYKNNWWTDQHLDTKWMNGSTTVLLVKEKLPKTTFDFQLISNSQENSTQTKKRKKQRTKSELLRRRSSQNSFPGLSSPHDEAFSTFQDAEGAFVDCSLVWVLLCVCSFVFVDAQNAPWGWNWGAQEVHMVNLSFSDSTL